jgi:hypothetical protein
MMLIPDSHRNLAEAPVVASLSTIGADGTPQVTAVWFLTVGDGQDPHGSCVPLEGRVAITLRPTHIVAHG